MDSEKKTRSRIEWLIWGEGNIFLAEVEEEL